MTTRKRLYAGAACIILFMLLLNGFLFYSSNLNSEYLQTENVWGQQDSIRLSDYNKLNQILSSLPDSMKEAYAELNQSVNYLRQLFAIENKTYRSRADLDRFNDIDVPGLVSLNHSDSSDYEVYTSAAAIVGNALNYATYITSIPENIRILSGFYYADSSFGKFLLNNIAKCQRDYYGMEHIKPVPVTDQSANLLVQYHTTDILTVILLIILSIFAYRSLKYPQNSFIFSNKKMPVGLFAVYILSSAAMYITNILITESVLGLPDLSVPIQSLGSYYTCPYSVTFGSFLLIWLLIKLSAVIFFLMCFIAASTSKHKFIFSSVAVAFITTEYILVSPHAENMSIHQIFSEINLFSAFTPERFFNRYLNLKIFSSAVPRLTLFLCVYMLMFIPLSVIVIRRLLALAGQTRNELQKSYYAEIDAKYSETRRLWHDFNNHLLTIKSLYASGHADEAEKYIDDISDRGKSYLLPTRTGSNALDLLFYQKNRTAADTGVKIEFITGSRLDKFHFADYDLCGLFGNLLDNALEACHNPVLSAPVIHVSIGNQGNMLIVSCQNPYSGTLSEKNGVLETTKKDSVNHGLGLTSVKQICKKYNGSVEINTENNTFTVTCLLNDR